MNPECNAIMVSVLIPGHVHTCVGKHHEQEDHLCVECHRRWYKA